MRFSRFAAAAFLPCWVRANKEARDLASNVFERIEAAITYSTSTSTSVEAAVETPFIPSRHIEFEHDSYRLFVSVLPKSADSLSCGDSDVVFYTSTGPVSVHSTSDSEFPQTELQVSSIAGNDTHFIGIQLESICIWQPTHRNLGPATVIELISATVTRPDTHSKPNQRVSGFTIHWDLTKQEIVAIVGQQIIQPGQHISEAIPPQVDVPLDQSLPDVSQLEQSDSDILELLIHQVNQDEDELERLVLRIAENRKLIDEVIASPDNSDDESLGSCGDLKCVLKTIFQKSKNCIHRIYLGVADIVKHKKEPCSYMSSASPASRVKVLMDPASSCYDEKKPPSAKQYTLLEEDRDPDESSSNDDFNLVPSVSPPPYTASNIEGESLPETRSNISTLLVVLSVVFCFGCVGCYTHSCCCNPRAKANRAARYEEIRTQHEYRRLARRHAIRDWWANLGKGFGRCTCCGGRDKDRVANYEEKRAMIFRQEQVLEDAAQEEIRWIRANHRDTAMAAEEGRSTVPLPRHLQRLARRTSTTGPRLGRASTASSVSSTGAESLPSYRSRASPVSWTRPPSYHERTSLIQSPTTEVTDFDPSAYVCDGFYNYFPNPSSSDETSSTRASSDIASDITPDSSVIALSPRGSSETLRTERSLGL